RLDFVVGGDDLDGVDLVDHVQDLVGQTAGRLKIGPHAAAQVDRLTHVDDVALDVAEDVDAGTSRQALDHRFQVGSNHRTRPLPENPSPRSWYHGRSSRPPRNAEGPSPTGTGLPILEKPGANASG